MGKMSQLASTPSGPPVSQLGPWNVPVRSLVSIGAPPRLPLFGAPKM